MVIQYHVSFRCFLQCIKESPDPLPTIPQIRIIYMLIIGLPHDPQSFFLQLGIQVLCILRTAKRHRLPSQLPVTGQYEDRLRLIYDLREVLHQFRLNPGVATGRLLLRLRTIQDPVHIKKNHLHLLHPLRFPALLLQYFVSLYLNINGLFVSYCRHSTYTVPRLPCLFPAMMISICPESSSSR